jgi:hypothetical protein
LETLTARVATTLETLTGTLTARVANLEALPARVDNLESWIVFWAGQESKAAESQGEGQASATSEGADAAKS